MPEMVPSILSLLTACLEKLTLIEALLVKIEENTRPKK